jgi:hypothetical protein
MKLPFDDIAITDIMVSEPDPTPATSRPEPARTPRAIQAREMANWKAQPIDRSVICKHGAVLTVETCEEGCTR